MILSWRHDLPDKERRIFDARYNDGLTVSQAITRYCVTRKVLHKRFNRALALIAARAMGARREAA